MSNRVQPDLIEVKPCEALASRIIEQARGDRPLMRFLRAIATRQITESIQWNHERVVDAVLRLGADGLLSRHRLESAIDPRNVWVAWELPRQWEARRVMYEMGLIEEERLPRASNAAESYVGVRLSPLGWNVVGSPEQMQAVALLGGSW